MSTIPASHFVEVLPGVIGGGGNALALNGILLTEDTSIPIGTVMPFVQSGLATWFGDTATETLLGNIYFGGRNNKTVTPGLLYIAQYNSAAVSGYLRSGSLAAITLTELQALSGTLTITFAGSALTSSTINLSAATSFSNAATIIEAGFTTPPFAVTWDVLRSAFVFTSTLTGATETITYASGTLAAGLYLTEATGAVLSQGADAQTPAGMMNQILTQTRNWATFTSTFEPVVADKLAFSAWVNGQNNRFAYIGWDTATAGTVVPDTTSWMYQVNQLNYSGTVGIYNSADAAAMFMGIAASIDFNRTNGRITFAYKYLDGVPATVTDETTATNLETNGYNYIGNTATDNQSFTFAFPGSVSGPYLFLDPFLNQVYMNAQFQLALMTLQTGTNIINYDSAGYTQIRQALMDPINQMLNFGGIVPGVPLSSLQASEVNTAAGQDIANTLSTRGWYLQILPATAQVRAARGSPPITFWYMDGGAVQKITLASIVVL